MKSNTQDQNPPGSQQHNQPSGNTCQASTKAISSTLTALANMRLLNLSTAAEFQFWESALADMTEVELLRGVRKSLDFNGKFFHLPAFRNLCRISREDIGAPESRQAWSDYMSETCHPSDHLGLIAESVDMAGGTFSLGRMDEVSGRHIFRECYDAALKNLLSEVNNERMLLPGEKGQNNTTEKLR